ncbi:MAG: hypothetical protein K9H61_04630 [Bacteroidia bacterium]|nr:hypothetical protein [Bacteroidia bacterium]MCF8446263.1 hypothetical protein [Bacteroidia bacterium]
MTNKAILKLASLLLGIFCLNQVNAQTTDSLLKDNKITVIKDFIPVLSEAIKIPVNPNPEKPEIIPPVFNYDIPSKQFLVQPTIYTIKPLSVGTMLLPKLKGNYMKLGFGNNQMPLAEVYLNTVRNKQYQAGMFLKHLSGNGDANYNNFANSTAYGYVKKFTQKGVFGADAYFHRNMVNYYGSPNDVLDLKNNEPKVVYHLYDIKTNYQNYTKDSNGLIYKLDLNYYNFNNSGSFNENDVAIKAKISKSYASIPFELLTGLRINNNSIKDLNSNWNNYQRIYFDLNPQIFMNGNDYYLRGGFNSTIASDTAGSGFHFFPKAEGGYSIIARKMVVYAGLTGKLEPNTYRSILTENPFVNQMLLKNTVNKIEIYGGLKGELTPQTSYQISTSSVSVENMTFYSQDSIKGSQILLYDKGNSKFTTLSFGLQHQLNDKFRLGFVSNIYGYQLKNLTRAYGRPEFEAKLNTTYNIGDKFLIKLDLIYWGERYGRLDANRADSTFGSTDYKMKPFVDLNIGIDYRYNKNFSAFITFNNIANNNYQRFYSYPVYGINILGGFTFTF